MGKDVKMIRKGFSLIESLISLAVFLIILLGSVECFSLARKHFLELKEKYERDESVHASLDKIKIDLQAAGAGLHIPVALKLVNGIRIIDNTLTISSRDKVLSPLGNLISGQTRIQLAGTAGIKKGRLICIYSHDMGEVRSVTRVDRNSIVLSTAIQNTYLSGEYNLVLIKTVSVFLDRKQHILRRKVNTSPAQPLMEATARFSAFYHEASYLINLSLCPISHQEKSYEISAFAKNLGLAALY
jgi:prepilin-type N-terminal cleavage/methylation domain-containing protein